MDTPPEKEAGVTDGPFVSDTGSDGFNQDDKDMLRMGVSFLPL